MTARTRTFLCLFCCTAFILAMLLFLRTVMNITKAAYRSRAYLLVCHSSAIQVNIFIAVSSFYPAFLRPAFNRSPAFNRESTVTFIYTGHKIQDWQFWFKFQTPYTAIIQRKIPNCFLTYNQDLYVKNIKSGSLQMFYIIFSTLKLLTTLRKS